MLLYHFFFSSGRHREEGLLELREQKRWRREHGLTMKDEKNGLEHLETESSDLSSGSSLSNFYTSKHERLGEVCKKKHFQAPCQTFQKWQCVHDGHR